MGIEKLFLISQSVIPKLIIVLKIQKKDHFLFKSEMEKILEKEKDEKDKEKGKKVVKDKAVEEIQMEVNTLSTIDFKLTYEDFILGLLLLL